MWNFIKRWMCNKRIWKKEFIYTHIYILKVWTQQLMTRMGFLYTDHPLNANGGYI